MMLRKGAIQKDEQTRVAALAGTFTLANACAVSGAHDSTSQALGLADRFLAQQSSVRAKTYEQLCAFVDAHSEYTPYVLEVCCRQFSGLLAPEHHARFPLDIEKCAGAEPVAALIHALTTLISALPQHQEQVTMHHITRCTIFCSTASVVDFGLRRDADFEQKDCLERLGLVLSIYQALLAHEVLQQGIVLHC